MSEKSTEKKSITLSLKKFYVILGTLLVLLIPVALLNGIVNERESYRNEAVNSVAASWAARQTIKAPEMYFTLNNNKKEEPISLKLNNYEVDTKINIEIRKKGIFKVPVYTADVTLKGSYINPYPNIKNVKSILNFNVSDSKGFVDKPVFKLNDNNAVSAIENKIVKILPAPPNRIPFEISYKIRGLNEILVTPGGELSKISISGNWGNPSFIGNFLPISKNVSSEEFSAQWSIPQIAVSSESDNCGVSLLTPVDNYRMALRAVKYAFLFLSLTFLSFFIFEITSYKSRGIHPLQYLMIGAAMLIFYLLLVSFSEFIPFLPAYIGSSVMTILLISSYTYFVLAKKQNLPFSLFIAGILTLLYGYLYALLISQDFSLLLGSIGLFLIIAVTMYATRNVNWYND